MATDDRPDSRKVQASLSIFLGAIAQFGRALDLFTVLAFPSSVFG